MQIIITQSPAILHEFSYLCVGRTSIFELVVVLSWLTQPVSASDLGSSTDSHQGDIRAGRHDGTLSACPHCTQPIESAECFHTHIDIVCEAGGAKHQCRVCGYKVKDKIKMAEHLRIHTSSKPFCCPHCPYRTACSNALILHIGSGHKGD